MSIIEGGSACRSPGEFDWTAELVDQIDFHWTTQARPRLDGLTDAEYFWEPSPGTWTVHPHGQSRTAMQAGVGEWVIDFDYPAPEPAPVTSIAWRLGHIIVGVLLSRVAGHFGGRPVDYSTHAYASTAAEALEQLDEAYAAWLAGIRSLDAEALARPVGDVEGPWAHRSMATLVLHIDRELIHHLAEIALLRNLWVNGLSTESARR